MARIDTIEPSDPESTRAIERARARARARVTAIVRACNKAKTRALA